MFISFRAKIKIFSIAVVTLAIPYDCNCDYYALKSKSVSNQHSLNSKCTQSFGHAHRNTCMQVTWSLRIVPIHDATSLQTVCVSESTGTFKSAGCYISSLLYIARGPCPSSTSQSEIGFTWRTILCECLNGDSDYVFWQAFLFFHLLLLRSFIRCSRCFRYLILYFFSHFLFQHFMVSSLESQSMLCILFRKFDTLHTPTMRRRWHYITKTKSE